MDLQQILTIVFAVGSSSVLTAAVNGWINRKPVKINATAALSDAAVRRVEAVERRADRTELRMQQFESRAYIHGIWDNKAWRRLPEQDQNEIGPPPSLWPNLDEHGS